MGNNFSADQIEKNFGHSVSVLSGPPGSNAPSYSSSPPPTSLGRTIVASPLPVYTRTTPRGFHHNVFIMYHGTSRQNAVSIIKTGFRPSAGGNLGAGVYVSKDFNKAQNFGECIFKLLVYAGKVKKLTLGCGFRWQDDYNSAWAPASGTQMEENCVKESSFIKILGLCKGIEHISSQVKIQEVEAGDLDSDSEKRKLKRFVREHRLKTRQ